jgi:hypothetical protein
VECSVEARPDSVPKGVVLETAFEVPDWISMSPHLPCVSQFIFMPFSADFFQPQLMLRIRDDRLVTRLLKQVNRQLCVRRLLNSLFLIENG